MKIRMIIALCFLGLGVKAQVSLAPTAVFLDKNGVGSLFVTNSGSTPQEINISFQFGYPAQDENGGLIMVYNDSIRSKSNSLDSYVKAFPRTFILPPNQQQIVRLQVRPPKDWKEGMYFTRLKVGSGSQVADVGSDDGNSGISTRVSVKFEQVIVAFYKNGNVNTGVMIEKINSRLDSNMLFVDAHFKITGNAPYLGRMKTVVKGPDGKEIISYSQSVALYFGGIRRLPIQLPADFSAGKYEVELSFETARNDVPSEDIVKAAPYTYKGSIQVNRN